MNNITLAFSVSPNVAQNPLTFRARLNGQPFFEKIIDQCYYCEYTFDEDQSTHNILELELSNKTTDHTRVDEHGKIIEDSLIYIRDIRFENINIDQLIYDHANYIHDFNGTQLPHTESFYGAMGCNGTVRFEFNSPFYIWLLENM
jgi:hypothetical protein